MTTETCLPYHHVQFAPWCIATLAVGIGVVLGTLWFLVYPVLAHYGVTPTACLEVTAMQWAVVGLLVEAMVLAGVLALLYQMTVTVNDTLVIARFGVGLYQKIIPLGQIQSATPASNQWWWGWGIKCFKTPSGTFGWLYNVAGLQAVEVVLTDGKVVRIGTDDPQGLARAITERLA